MNLYKKWCMIIVVHHFFAWESQDLNKALSVFIIFCFLQLNIISLKAFADNTNSDSAFQGHVEATDKKTSEKSPIFTGETAKIETNDVINMTVSQVLSAGVNEQGDEFFAEITNDVVGSKGVLLPLGTVAHGCIKDVAASKRLGRDGWVELSFDYLITPDGREIPIEGQMSTKLHPVVSVAKTVAEDAGYSLAGGLVGGLTALNLFGIEGAVASQGYTVMGGAGVGAAVGLGISLIRKGKDFLISPGDLIKVKIKRELALPVISQDALRQQEIKYEGLDVKITNIKLEKDPFGNPNTIDLSLLIKNNSHTDFSSFDISLINDLNAVYYPSIFAENSLAFAQIKSGDRVGGHLSFAVDNPNRKHWLVFYNRQNRKPLAKISVDNAKREIDLKQGKKHKKERYKTNTFLKDTEF